MTAQEQQLIDELVARIRATNVQGKDAEAEQRLQQGVANSPDALYILAQTVIVQKYGLEQAQQRIQAMQSELESLRDAAQQQAPPKPSGGSFLSNIFGGGSQQSQQQPQQSAPGGWQSVSNPSYGQGGYPPQQGYPQQGYPQQGYPPAAGYPPPPPPGYGQPSGWGGSPMGGAGGGFLHSALQTAAGVAIGEVAVQGVESLFHGFGGSGGYGRGFSGGQRSETIINNYEYGDEHRREDSRDHDNDRDDSFYNPHNDASRDEDKRGFSDAGGRDEDSGNDDNSDDSDDNNYDSGDDGSSDSGDDGGSGSGDDNY